MKQMKPICYDDCIGGRGDPYVLNLINDGPRLKQNRFSGRKAKENLLNFLKPAHGPLKGYNIAVS